MRTDKFYRIYQLNAELYKVTGIQRVIMDIHEALRPLGSRIVGTIPYGQVNPDLGIATEDYEQLRGFRMFRNAVVIIHERRYLPIFWLWNKLLRLNAHVVYVHHNELYGQRLLSRFPDHVVAISDAGIRNLTEYFGVPRDHITKIHNCVRRPEGFVLQRKQFDPENITILYPARINSVKRQIEIVEQLRGKLDHRVRILFVGTGPSYDELRQVCKGSEQFVVFGYRNDVISLMQQADFMMLFSRHEGLPISLIEAAMTGTPIICNAVGGNTEIAIDSQNAFVVDNTYPALLTFLNSLPSTLTESKIMEMSKEGIKVFEKRFGFEIFKNNYLNLLQHI